MNRLRNFHMSDLSRTAAVLITVAVYAGIVGSGIAAAFIGSVWVLIIGMVISMSPWLVDAFNESA